MLPQVLQHCSCPPSSRELEKESNFRAEIVQFDVPNDKSIADALKIVEELCRHHNAFFHLLVNNAGISRAPGQNKSVSENYAAFLDTNVISVTIMTDSFIPLLAKSAHVLAGSIITVASTKGSLLLNGQNKAPPSRSIPYSVSKATLNLLTVDYARIWKGNVRVNAIAPPHCASNLSEYNGTKTLEQGGGKRCCRSLMRKM